MKQNLITGSYNDILEHLTRAEYGAHHILIYPDTKTLREIYSRYVKSQLEGNNEIVLILSYYETTDSVRKTLSEGLVNIVEGSGNDGSADDTRSNNIIDVRKYEMEGSLIIMDSVKGYFGSDNDYEGEDRLMSFVTQLVKKAESLGKNGVSVIADLGSFYHYYHSEIDKLVEYELSLPSRYDGMRIKGFCIYHKEDLDKRFTEEQKQKLLDHHAKALMIAN